MMALILAMAVVTYLTRSAFFLGLVGSQTFGRLEKALKYVPVAILAAIIAPGVLAPQGTLALDASNPYLWGGAAAALAAVRGRGPLGTMLAGVAATALARLVL